MRPLRLLSDHDDDLASRPDDEAVLLDVAARFASEHGVPAPDGRPRTGSVAAPGRPAVAAARGPAAGRVDAEDEVVELLRDAVDARDRFPRLWAAATENGAVGGRELRQLVRQHRDKALGRDAPDRRRSGRRPAVRARSLARRVPSQSVPRAAARPRSDRRPDPRPARRATCRTRTASGSAEPTSDLAYARRRGRRATASVSLVTDEEQSGSRGRRGRAPGRHRDRRRLGHRCRVRGRAGA